MDNDNRLILPHRIEYGFTLAELMIVVVVMVILTAIGMSMFYGSTETARNIERKNDITAIYNELERSYRTRSAISEPSYPATTSNVKEQIAQLAENGDIVMAPGVNHNSITPAPNPYSSQYPGPNQYIYQSFKSNGQLCTSEPCVRYVLYYLKEPNEIIEVHSMRQQ